MIALTSIEDFNRILARLSMAGKKPCWYGIGKVLFICTEEQLKQAKLKYSKA